MRIRALSVARRFAADTAGVSAVEFALILPVLLLLLLGTVDLTRAIDIKSRTAQLSRTIADFISQNKTVTPADLSNIIAASKSVLFPYSSSTSVLQIDIYSINKSGGSYKIDWSYSAGKTTVADASDRSVVGLVPPDIYTIGTIVTYTYDLQFGNIMRNLSFSKLTLSSQSAMSPRWGAPITASGTGWK